MRKKPKFEKLLKNSNGQYRYLFNWVGGGYNDVWACNLTEFKVEIKRRFPNSNLEVDYNTLYKATRSEADAWDKMADLNWN